MARATRGRRRRRRRAPIAGLLARLRRRARRPIRMRRSAVRRRRRAVRDDRVLWRAPGTGRYTGRYIPGARRLHWIGGGGWRNPILPFPLENPRHGGRRRRRGYRRNPVLPYMASNIAGILDYPRQLLDVEFMTRTALPMVGGFLGTKLVGATVYGILGQQVLKTEPGTMTDNLVRIGSDAIGGGVLAWAVGNFIDRRMGQAVWTGAVVSIAHSILRLLIGGTEIGRAIGLGEMGAVTDEVAASLREELAKRLQTEVSGIGGSGMVDGTMGEFVTREALTPIQVGEYQTLESMRLSPSFSVGPAADVRDYDVARTETSI